ncbi:MAG: ABC transporter permease [Ignavibacteriales bacterium]|nr:ABC transporter permease [Ignavibacteriales bacterium]
MLSNYLKIAVRNLTKHPLYSAINIVGLAVGLASTLLIAGWVLDEVSYDRFHPNVEHLYRMNWDFKMEDREGIGPGTPPPLAGAMVRDVPGVAAATRLRNMASAVVRSEDKFFSENGIVAADSNMFELFGFRMLEGDARSALRYPNSVVLTETSAKKYFGDAPAVGKLLMIGERVQDLYGTYQNLFTVTGVVQQPPHNSHIQFDILTSMSSYPEVAWRDWSWMWMQMVTYASLEPEASLPYVQQRVHEVVKKHLSESRRGKITYDQIFKNNWRWQFVFQPMTDIYLGSGDTGNRLGPVGNRMYVYLFSTIACFVLLIACVNFMNLATARAAVRAREVGMRKVLGSGRQMLITQFLVESFVLSALAMVVALILVEALLGPFNTISGKSLEMHFFNPPWLPFALVSLTVVVALLAGSYPSLYLSSFLPLHAFKRTIRLSNRQWSLRNILVLFQFTVTIGLIACTILVERQLRYVGNADLGFQKDGLVVISNMNKRLGDLAEVYKERIKNHSHIINASVSTGIPPYGGFQDSYTAGGQADKIFDLISYKTDDDLVSTLGIEIVRGRGFSREFLTNASGVILNEAAVRYLGWEDPIGKTILYPGGSGEFEVIGVMRDFHFLTLRSPVTPFALFHNSSNTYDIPSSFIVVRIPRKDMEATIKLLESEWKAVSPTTPFEYEFLDKSLESQYEADYRFGKVFFAFSLLTIFVACIGLLGLVSFSTEQRTKEIGVRKVLGASVAGVVGLLSGEYLKLIVIANVASWPLAYVLMDMWLQDFANRVEITWWVFALAGSLAFVIALLTVSVQAVKAARANPVESLRYE